MPTIDDHFYYLANNEDHFWLQLNDKYHFLIMIKMWNLFLVVGLDNIDDFFCQKKTPNLVCCQLMAKIMSVQCQNLTHQFVEIFNSRLKIVDTYVNE
jgi:hypothetical protein